MGFQNAGRIAVVEDEDSIRETVSYALEREGYRVETYADGLEAWQSFQSELPDVAVLDIVLPRMDGLELCRKLRSLSDILPIIFLTSRDEELDRVLGLELGADDYLCKPFSIRELTARIKVLFRRLDLMRRNDCPSEVQQTVVAGPFCLDLQRYQLTYRKEIVPLTVTEFMILHALIRHPGHVKSRTQLMEESYPNDAFVSERTIDSHIKRLRAKLANVVPGFEAIESVYGVGYRFREPE
jgi:DNA-binding response OmpR family regulator